MLRAWARAPSARRTPALAIPTVSLAGSARVVAESRVRRRTTGAWLWAWRRVADNGRLALSASEASRAPKRVIDRIRGSKRSGVGRQGSADPAQEVPDELVELLFGLVRDLARHDVAHDGV